MSNRTPQHIVRHLKQLFFRYLPAEIAGTVGALTFASIAYVVSDRSLAIAAVAGTIGENIGYYGVASVREILHYYTRHHGHATLRRLWLTGVHTIRGMLTEFGPAELVDSLFMRPLLFYFVPQVTGSVVLGWVLGKLLADIVFYALAATGYELRRRLYQEDRQALKPEPTEPV